MENVAEHCMETRGWLSVTGSLFVTRTCRTNPGYDIYVFSCDVSDLTLVWPATESCHFPAYCTRHCKTIKSVNITFHSEIKSISWKCEFKATHCLNLSNCVENEVSQNLRNSLTGNMANITGLLLHLHRFSILKRTKRYGNWICFRPQVRGQLCPLHRANTRHWTS